MSAEDLGSKGEFRLLSKIGEGGMADVFLAERVGDECAEDLRVGRCDRTIWLLALESYEKAWGAVLERRVGHQSLAA